MSGIAVSSILSFSIALELGIGRELVDPTLWTRAMKSRAIGELGPAAHLFRSPVTTPPAANFALVGRLQVGRFDLDWRYALQTSRQRSFQHLV